MAAANTTRRKAAAKPAPEPEVVEDEFEDMEDVEDTDEELEELEDGDEVEDVETEKPKRKPPVRPKIAFGSAELAAHVTEVTGENYDGRSIRMLLRKLAKDEKLPRVIGEDRTRYEFSGPNDPTVKLVVKMVQDGTAKALKQEGLQAVKDAAAAKREAKKAAAAAAQAEPETEDEMDEVEEAPAPKKTVRRSATKAAPAKATPATARRRAAAAK